MDADYQGEVVARTKADKDIAEGMKGMVISQNGDYIKVKWMNGMVRGCWVDDVVVIESED